MKQDILNLAKELVFASGVSGNEENLHKNCFDFFNDIGKTSATNVNSVLCDVDCKNTNKPKILLSAHLDQIGMIVTNVFDNGFLKVSAVGGLDARLLQGQRVKVVTSTDVLNAVICSTPPHLQQGEEKTPSIDELVIDTGIEKNAKDKISVGDTVCFSPNFKVLNKDFITATSLDNRIGCVAVMLAAKKLKQDNVDCNVSVLLTSQEEVGTVGAMADSKNIKADIALVVDVSFAKGFGAPDEKCGEMGKGAMIGLSPILNRNNFNRLINIAKNKDINYQTEIMGGRTGTDCDDIAVSAKGVKTSLLSVPLLNMHTPVEKVCIDDVESVIELICEFVKEISNE